MTGLIPAGPKCHEKLNRFEMIETRFGLANHIQAKQVSLTILHVQSVDSIIHQQKNKGIVHK